MKNKNKTIHWTPRILTILFILFLSLFSLDIFEMSLGFWGTIIGLLIHNIPTIILTILLIIAWKYEIVGGITFFSAGILYIILNVINAIKNPFEWYTISYSLIIAGPAFLIGALFTYEWRVKKRTPNS